MSISAIFLMAWRYIFLALQQLKTILYGITKADIHYQLSSEELHALTVSKGMGVNSDLGALAVNTGEFTGRSPMDRFIVKDGITEDKVWWGDINIPFESEKFDALYEKVIAYLNDKELFVRDAYACAESDYR